MIQKKSWIRPWLIVFMILCATLHKESLTWIPIFKKNEGLELCAI